MKGSGGQGWHTARTPAWVIRVRCASGAPHSYRGQRHGPCACAWTWRIHSTGLHIRACLCPRVHAGPHPFAVRCVWGGFARGSRTIASGGRSSFLIHLFTSFGLPDHAGVGVGMSACACVRACVRARVRVCACRCTKGYDPHKPWLDCLLRTQALLRGQGMGSNGRSPCSLIPMPYNKLVSRACGRAWACPRFVNRPYLCPPNSEYRLSLSSSSVFSSRGNRGRRSGPYKTKAAFANTEAFRACPKILLLCTRDTGIL